MKKILLALATAFTTLSASAGPAPTLPAGPLYLQFVGQEQIAVGNAHTYGTKEINWGVFVVSTLATGKVGTPNDLINEDTLQKAFFTNMSGGQITGMFYGIEKGGASASNPFPATGGFLDLYWRDTSKLAATAVDSTSSGVRCGVDCAKGYTDGTLLAHLYFDTGIDDGNDLNTVLGTTVPSSNNNFKGFASSYLSVDMSRTGLWSDKLNGNWFATDGLGNRDMRIDNVYSKNANWNGAAGSNILGAQMTAGAGQAYLLPEPGVLSLMGLSMLGMGAVLRRRRG
jgi:hypothetical protein